MELKIGEISDKIIATLALDESKLSNKAIYIGDSNINHMITNHYAAYVKYGTQIPSILSSPDYIAYNSINDSIEYVKEFKIDNEYVKVAVRASQSGNKFYARTIYILNINRVNNFISKGTLKRL